MQGFAKSKLPNCISCPTVRNRPSRPRRSANQSCQKRPILGRSWVDTGESGVDFESEFVLPAVKLRNQLAAAESEIANADKDAADTATTETNSTIEGPPADIPQYVEPEISPEEIEAARFAWADGKFGDAIAKRRAARGVIILYADDEYYDTTLLLRFIEQGRNRIAAGAKLPPDRIDVVYGGYKAGLKVEFWIVPNNGAPPMPTPEVRKPDTADYSRDPS